MLEFPSPMNALLLLVLLAAPAVLAQPAAEAVAVEVAFKSGRLAEHFKKHGPEMGYRSAEEYLLGARRLLGRKGTLQKERADGERLFYDPRSNEFAVLAKDGRTLRTFFKPNGGRRYWDRQARGP